MAEEMKMNLTLTGPIGFRVFELPKVCQESTPHTHNYDHCTMVLRGSVAVLVDGVEVGRVSADDDNPTIHVAADSLHTIKALEPDTRYACIFSHRDMNGVVVQTYENEKAYR